MICVIAKYNHMQDESHVMYSYESDTLNLMFDLQIDISCMLMAHTRA